MVITLKNGVKIELEWSFLVMQYLEEYEGGLRALKEDMRRREHLMKIQNIFLYAAVRANYDPVLSYNDAIKLIDFKDVDPINKFYQKAFEEQEMFKKKDQKFVPKKMR